MQHGFMQYLCQINNAQQGTPFQSFNTFPPFNKRPMVTMTTQLPTFNKAWVLSASECLQTLPNLNSHWCTVKNMLFRQEDLLLGTPSQIVLGEGVTKVSEVLSCFFIFFWRGIVTLAADAATSWSSVHIARCCFNTYMPDWWGYRSL